MTYGSNSLAQQPHFPPHCRSSIHTGLKLDPAQEGITHSRNTPSPRSATPSSTQTRNEWLQAQEAEAAGDLVPSLNCEIKDSCILDLINQNHQTPKHVRGMSQSDSNQEDEQTDGLSARVRLDVINRAGMGTHSSDNDITIRRRAEQNQGQRNEREREYNTRVRDRESG